jgi:LDH2 family malate/lactate/ureidoglycolate dehydrogenase
MTNVTIDDARRKAVRVLMVHHLDKDDAEIVADHLVDAHLTGYTFAGLPRLLVVLDRIRGAGGVPSPVEIVRQSPTAAHVHGNGNLGYVVCRRAVDLAIEMAGESGVAVVGADDSYYSGRSGYYTERAARAGFVAIHASSAFAMAAPLGGSRPVLGSNPVSFAFPAGEHPVVVDMSTAAATWGELQLAVRTSQLLPEGVAIDADGQPTRDPQAALLGAVLPWGGHKGYALALAVQALGVFAGGDAVPAPFDNFGFVFVVMRRDLFTSAQRFDEQMSQLIDAVRRTPSTNGAPVLIPGQRGGQRRAAAIEAGYIDVPDQVWSALEELVAD